MIPVFWFTVRVIAYVYVLLVLYAAAMLLLEYWRSHRERRREPAPCGIALVAARGLQAVLDPDAAAPWRVHNREQFAFRYSQGARTRRAAG